MEQENQPEITETAQTETPTNLSLQDLLMVVQTLQVVTQRGAIRAEEMSNIGGLYDRIAKFLVDSGAINTSDETAEEEIAEDTPEADTTAVGE
jgi:hypothetical protein